jgi:hypothetical protein
MSELLMKPDPAAADTPVGGPQAQHGASLIGPFCARCGQSAEALVGLGEN